MRETVSMEECESVAFEMTELQEFEASDVNSQDDEDEVEELQNRYFLKLYVLDGKDFSFGFVQNFC